MSNKFEISPRQFMILVIFFVIGNTFIDEPGEIALRSGRDAWIATIFAIFFGLGIAWFWIKLQKRIGNMNIIEANEFFFGKILGKIISFFFFLYFMVSFLYTIYIFIDFTSLNLLSGTSRILLGSLFVGVVLFSVRKGLAVITRVSELVFPIVILLLAMFFVLILPKVDIQFLCPVLEDGTLPVVRGAIELLSSPFFELVTLMVIYSFVRGEKKPGQSFYVGILLGGMILLVLNILAITVLGVTQVKETVYAGFTLAKIVNVGEFLNRIESVISISWMMSQVIYGAVSFYAASYTLARVLELDSLRVLTYPLALISLVYSPDLIERRMIFNLNFWFPYSLVFGIVLPLILFILTIVRKKKLSTT